MLGRENPHAPHGAALHTLAGATRMRGAVLRSGAQRPAAAPLVLLRRRWRPPGAAAGQALVKRSRELGAAQRVREQLEAFCEQAQLQCAASPREDRRGASPAPTCQRPGASAEEQQEHAVCQLLDELYAELEEVFMSKRGYVVSRKEQRLIESTGGSAVYGEVQPSGIGAVLDVLCGACEDEQEHEVKAAEHRVFMDLGSGLGRVVLQAALSPRSHSPATGQPWFNQYVGLELSPSRLEQSLHVLDRLRQQGGAWAAAAQQLPAGKPQRQAAGQGRSDAAATEAWAAAAGGTCLAQQEATQAPAASTTVSAAVSANALSRVRFEEQDVTESPLLADATHVFMCSTAFGAVACRRIVERLHASPRFRVLVTSRELPFQDKLLRLGSVPRVPMSWNERGELHVYMRRDLRRAPPHLLRRFCTSAGGQGEGGAPAVAWLPCGAHGHVPTAAQEPLEGWRVRFLPDLRWRPGGAGEAEEEQAQAAEAERQRSDAASAN